MKKDYPVILDEKARDMDFIKVSAGKVGHSIRLRPDDFIRATGGKFEDVTRC